MGADGELGVAKVEMVEEGIVELRERVGLGVDEIIRRVRVKKLEIGE